MFINFFCIETFSIGSIRLLIVEIWLVNVYFSMIAKYYGINKNKVFIGFDSKRKGRDTRSTVLSGLYLVWIGGGWKDGFKKALA